MGEMVIGLYVFVLATLAGREVITKVPPTLHTPLMSGANAISGIAIVGALVVMVRVANPAHPDGVILAILMGSILAPLIDHVVIWFNVRQRAKGYG